MKKCARCEMTKSIDCYWRDGKSPDGYGYWCQECQQEYRKEHRDMYLEHSKRWARNHPEKVRENQKRWVLNNPEKSKESKKNWNNKNYYKILNYRVREREGMTDEITKEEYEEIISSSGGVCFYCRTELTNENRTIDHYVPLSRGGEHSISNIVCCCNSCNSSKQNRLFGYEWVGKKS